MWLNQGGRASVAFSRSHPTRRKDRRQRTSDGQREAIAAARDLVTLRDGWLNPPGLDEAELAKRTLTNLYNQRPTWLSNAHATLDAAVFAAYAWPADLPGEEVLARLLALNLDRDAEPRPGA